MIGENPIHDTLTLEVNEVATLTATVTPEETAEVIWSSSDESVATVVGGVVTAVAPGNAVVTAAVGDMSAQCMVTVAAPAPDPEPDPAPEVSSVQLNETILTMTEGDTVTLMATVLPAEAVADMTWYTTDSAVATVEEGFVTAVSEGKAIITVDAGDHSASCTITVKAPSLEPEKLVPEVSVDVTFANSRTTVIGQSDIGVNPDLYYTEVKHGVLYIISSQLGSRNLLVSTSGATNKVLSSYEEDGSFSHTFKPLNSSMAYTYRAYVYYEKPDGSRIYEYSPMVRGSGRSFSVG